MALHLVRAWSTYTGMDMGVSLPAALPPTPTPHTHTQAHQHDCMQVCIPTIHTHARVHTHTHTLQILSLIHI